jgi:hypothetical protein
MERSLTSALIHNSSIRGDRVAYLKNKRCEDSGEEEEEKFEDKPFDENDFYAKKRKRKPNKVILHLEPIPIAVVRPMSPTKGSWRSLVRERLGGRVPRRCLSSSNPLSNLYHRRPWMSLLPSYHGSGIDIFLRPRSAGFRLEDL